MRGFGLLDILTVYVIVLFFWGIRKEKTNVCDSGFFSKDKTLAIKGVAVLVPILKHLSDAGVEGGKIILTLTNLVEVAPLLFFVISGYGLTKQNLIKENYSKGFLIKRFPKVLVPYVLATIIMVAANFVFNGFLYMPHDIIHAILCGDPIVKYSWYVIHILLFYLWFYFLMKVFGKNNIFIILGGIVYYVITTVLFVNMGFPMHWWGTSFALVAGMLLAAYEQKIFDFFQRRYLIKFVAFIAVMVLLYYFEPKLQRVLHISNFPPNAFFELLFGCGIVIFLIKFSVGNPVSRFLGKYSYEIYILQGLFIIAGKSAKLHLEGDIYVWVVLVGSIISGVALYYVDKFILSKIIRV